MCIKLMGTGVGIPGCKFHSWSETGRSVLSGLGRLLRKSPDNNPNKCVRMVLLRDFISVYLNKRIAVVIVFEGGGWGGGGACAAAAATVGTA